MRSFGPSFVLVLFSVFCFGQVTEDFDHNSISTSQSNCWQFVNATLSKPPSSRAINNGGDRPLADGSLSGLLGDASLISPYTKFDGSGTISFRHKLLDQDGAYSNLSVYIIDPNGNIVQTVLDHTYRIVYVNVSGDPTNVQTESVAITYTGYGRVYFYWSYVLSDTRGYLDDISIDGTYSADASQESSGYCPALFELTDTVCANAQNVSFNALYDVAYESYTWSFSGTSPGTIDATVSTNDSEIQIDFSGTSGNFILEGLESTSGNKTRFSIHIPAAPGLSYSTDSVCEGEGWAIDLSLSGDGPWELDYNDGTGTQTLNISSSTHTLALTESVNSVDFTELRDANDCSISSAELPTVDALRFPKPGPTGPIYH